MIGWLRRRHARIAEAERAARESERRRGEIEAQWPEVRELVASAKKQREMNHLTQLFIESRGHRT